MNAHILSISDPTLFLDDELISACFLGHWLRDPMPILAEIAAWFASSMKLGAEDWLFYGASAGGFAAMRAAALIPNGRAIVVNAFLELDCFDGRHLSARIAKVFGANMSLAEVKKVVPFRASAIAALRDAYTAGRKPRIIVAQNTNDGACYHNHFQPLCRAFDIPLDGGIDSRHRAIKAVPVDWADGHSDGAEGTTEWLFATQVPWLFERVPA
jgi:pimeloyl-ACP methyl ester carboxylesterase